MDANKKSNSCPVATDTALSVVILAAGKGKRMHSTLPKVLHPLGGQPLLRHVVKTAQQLNPQAIYGIYGYGGKQIQESLREVDLKWVEQAEPKGTGHAVLQALSHIPNHHRILVLYGDVPLIKAITLERLLQQVGHDQLGLLTAQLDNPQGFGRIIRNDAGDIMAIVEHNDASKEQLAIKEINTGIITVPAELIKKWLPLVKNDNVSGEYYLTDIVAMAVREQVSVKSMLAACNKEIAGINDKKELITLERYYQYQQAEQFLSQGVTIIDPTRFDCRGEVTIANDVFIDINVILEGNVTIEEGSIIGAHSVLRNVTVGRNVVIHPHCIIEDADIGSNCRIGPFARIRPHTQLRASVHIGNFVELKNTQINEGSKVGHLTYLGDATVGRKVNVGAFTVTCNFDGYSKFPTTIADGAFVGSGTALVAPINIGKNAYIGAGSTLTKDAPQDQLTLSRAKQITVKGWKKHKSSVKE